MKKHTLLAAIAAFSGGAALAGQAVTTIDTPAPIQAAPSSELGATIGVGYDTKYMFRGVDFGDNLVHSTLELELPLTDIVSLTIGAWYGDVTDSSFSELDLYTSLGIDLGAVSLSVGYTYYYFPDASDGAHEPNVGIGTSFGPVSVDLGFYADSEADAGDFGYYSALEVNYATDFGGPVGLELGALVSYGWNYYGVDDWNNVQISAGLPISLTDRATLTPYIAYSWALDGLDAVGQDDEIFGGVALEVTF
jgi:hypothetical protein